MYIKEDDYKKVNEKEVSIMRETYYELGTKVFNMPVYGVSGTGVLSSTKEPLAFESTLKQIIYHQSAPPLGTIPKVKAVNIANTDKNTTVVTLHLTDNGLCSFEVETPKSFVPKKVDENTVVRHLLLKDPEASYLKEGDYVVFPIDTQENLKKKIGKKFFVPHMLELLNKLGRVSGVLNPSKDREGLIYVTLNNQSYNYPLAVFKKVPKEVVEEAITRCKEASITDEELFGTVGKPKAVGYTRPYYDPTSNTSSINISQVTSGLVFSAGIDNRIARGNLSRTDSLSRRGTIDVHDGIVRSGQPYDLSERVRTLAEGTFEGEPI